MNWWEFVTELVGTRTFPLGECAKCGGDLMEYEKRGMPHSIQVPYGTMIANGFPIVCERCYARFLIMVAEWFDRKG